ncbi:MAG: hypothetical protein HN855_10085 [Anaerolineae bacterium]|nr:hypothetical protein [Anaerolineae bacterium]MBT7072066.1 hypothetical protein [Anaerolineae bacterium]MBT7325499.1 hypothetical protein [Anaerolineae bacterium]
MCKSCAVHTPTGYRCIDCVNDHKKNFETSLWYDYLTGFLTAAVLSGVGSAIVGVISNWFYGFAVLFFAPFAATIIANAAQAVTGRRRSRNLYITIAVGVVAGGLPAILGGVSTLLLILANPQYLGNISIWWILPLVWQVVYIFITTPAVYTSLSGLNFK